MTWTLSPMHGRLSARTQALDRRWIVKCDPRHHAPVECNLFMATQYLEFSAHAQSLNILSTNAHLCDPSSYPRSLSNALSATYIRRYSPTSGSLKAPVNIPTNTSSDDWKLNLAIAEQLVDRLDYLAWFDADCLHPILLEYPYSLEYSPAYHMIVKFG